MRVFVLRYPGSRRAARWPPRAHAGDRCARLCVVRMSMRGWPVEPRANSLRPCVPHLDSAPDVTLLPDHPNIPAYRGMLHCTPPNFWGDCDASFSNFAVRNVSFAASSMSWDAMALISSFICVPFEYEKPRTPPNVHVALCVYKRVHFQL